MLNKPYAQKAYEKIEMVRRNPDKVNVMIATDSFGRNSLVLMVDTTPIAMMLQEPNDLAPEHEKSEILKETFGEARSIDMRWHPDDFDTPNVLVAGIIEDGIKRLEI